ncbi:DNA-binding protein YbaB [Kibdelosporangium banguiense]|uniref:DNA-binding protein YbaB n=1 Tax=Kibdelosporangium banguiense TaxID=1365924 RepID=A0ABS4TP47_9PSEU|nr:YbaB/EbfC family nucleoid-associated protein [Kibdelosporangium banguiense]MBP2326178.1 DNA-binding protein YbaB [Kibdelosporangium banguiense]
MSDPHQYLADFENQLQSMKQQVDQVQNAFAEARAEARSADGAVTVVAAAGGRIEALSLSPKADSISHTTLATSILDTIRRAQAEAARKVEESMRPLLGQASQDFLHEQVLRATDPEAEGGTKQPRPASERPDDEFGGPILR